jgi:hypothetical protein
MDSQAESAGVLNFYACKGEHTLFSGQREKEIKRERKKEKREREIKRERKKERERER